MLSHPFLSSLSLTIPCALTSNFPTLSHFLAHSLSPSLSAFSLNLLGHDYLSDPLLPRLFQTAPASLSSVCLRNLSFPCKHSYGQLCSYLSQLRNHLQCFTLEGVTLNEVLKGIIFNHLGGEQTLVELRVRDTVIEIV